MLCIVRDNSIYRADLGTSATICADLRIDDVSLGFTNRFNRTFVYTHTTGNTLICDRIGHALTPSLTKLCFTHKWWEPL